MHIRHLYGDGVNNFIKTAVGVLLIIVPTLLLFQKRIEEKVAHRPPTMKGFAGMVADRPGRRIPGGHDLGRVGQHHHDVAAAVLQFPAQGECRH